MAFRWIHLSDLHFGAGDAGTDAHRQTVLFKLKADIVALQAKLGAPQFIWVTGDIAQKGEAKEYTTAKKWLDEIQQTTGAKVLVVPGNHDVARGAVLGDKNSLRLHGALRRGEENLDNALKDAGDRALLSAKLQNFLSFAQRYGWRRHQLWQKVEFPDQQLTILGLNTALLSLDNQDSPQNLALGQQQLNELVQAPGLAVVLGHHPPEWLKDGKELLGHLGNRAHLGFFGHVHEAGGGVSLGLGQQHFLLRASASHSPFGQDGYGYAWGELGPSGLVYYPRQWSGRRGSFIADNHQGDLDAREGLTLSDVQLPRALQEWLKRSFLPKNDRRINFFAPATKAPWADAKGQDQPSGPGLEKLSSYVFERGDRTNPATLLNARYQVVDFVDSVRAHELTFLQGWCDRSDRLAAQLFTGPGGAGKTRLMIEWCQRLKKQGWVAGFWGDHPEDEFKQVGAASQPAFLVVDYAESRTNLGALLRFLAQLPAEGQKIRVVLLARYESDWWTALKEAGTEVAHVLAAPPKPLDLTPPTALELYQHAVQSFAAILNQPIPPPRSDLTEPLFAEPLYVAMAALADVYGEPLAADEPLKAVVTLEKRFWTKPYEKELNDRQRPGFLRAASQSVAALVLRGGARDKAAWRKIVRLSGVKQEDWDEVARNLYPGKKDGSTAHYLSPLEPDLLGEQVVAQVLAEHENAAQFLKKVFRDADAAQLQAGFTVLGRLATRLPDAEVWITQLLKDNLAQKVLPALHAALAVGQKTAFSPLGELLAEAAERQNRAELAAAVYRLIPDQTVSLARLGAWALQAQLNADPEPRERARLLLKLGNRLGELGKGQAALEATQQAERIFKDLAESDPMIIPAWIGSLQNLAGRMSEMGQRKEALAINKRLVELHEELAEKDFETYAADLAASYTNLGHGCGMLGQYEEAVTAGKKATQLNWKVTRGEAQSHPKLEAALALSLQNLGVGWAQLGRKKKGLAATEKAVEIRKRLTQDEPDIYAPNLASSLDNFANLLASTGRVEDALACNQEAVEWYRKLAQVQPAAFEVHLARSIHNRACILNTLGRHPEALVASREAVQTYLLFFSREPKRLPALTEHFSNAFNHLGRHLKTAGLDPAQDPDWIAAQTLLREAGHEG